MTSESGPICQRKSTRYLKVPLTSTEQIYLIFLIPIVVNCIVYITHFSADLVVAAQHFREENPLWGSCTIFFMYAPALTYFMLTVSRPDWWMTDNDKLTKGVFIWFCCQVLQLISFPFFALYRYAGLIVLSVDAIFLSGEERRKTLNVAAAPAAIELYFFLQAWFQAAPQSIFQIHLLFRETPLHRSHQSVHIQILCILMNITILAIETASFQRFESQRVSGRKLPWAMWLKKYRVQELSNLEERVPLQLSVGNEEAIANGPAPSGQPDAAEESLKQEEPSKDEPKIETEPHVPLDRQVSVTPPLPPKNAHITPPPTPLRGITSVAPLPVPDAPAPPRPDSILKSDEQTSEATTFRTVSVVEPDRPPTTENDLIVPKRRHSTKGLEEDDPVGKFLAFLWWFFFIAARVLAIAVFYEFYPYYLLGVIGFHYVVMLAYLFYYAKYYDVITFFVNLWLGLVYTISVIEYRIKFKYADKWLLPYYVFVMTQNTSMTLIWFLHADWDGFWYAYAFSAIFVSMVLCISSSIVYHVLLMPKKRRVYIS